MIIYKHPIGTIGVMAGLPAVQTEFMWSLAQMIQYNQEYLCQPGEYVHLEKSHTSYHAWARNGLSQRIMGDFLLMLDTDHAFDPDLLCRMWALMKQNEIDVLTGLYHYRIPPYLPVLYWWDKTTEKYHVIGKWHEDKEREGLFRVSAAGAGCLMVRKRVFERISNELGEKPFDPIFTGTASFSEDFSFFQRLDKLGIATYCDPAIECHHLLTKPILHREVLDPGVAMTPVYPPKEAEAAA